MRIHVGCELRFEFPQTTPMISTLNVHFSRVSELERPDYLITNPPVPVEGYRDSFGNWCSRLVAPGGHFSLGTDAIIRDSGMSDPIDLNRRSPLSGNAIWGAETKAPKRHLKSNRQLAETKCAHESPPVRGYSQRAGKSLFARDCVVDRPERAHE